MVAHRRKPQQSRSRALVDAMFEAVNLLVPETGFGLTTNKVADVAGVSVGSVYQYFSSKESLLRAWVERIISLRAERTRERLHALLGAQTTLEDAFAQLIDVAIGARRTASYESRLSAAFLRFGGVEALRAADAELLPLMRDLLDAHCSRTRDVDPDLAAFILLHGMRAVLVAAAEDETKLRDPRLRAELLYLALAYLKRE